MQMTQLQDATEIVCLGWFLYSAEEFECKALRHEIRQITGVDVALTYRAIDGGFNADLQQLQNCPKALHLEIDRKDLNSFQPAIEKLYSSASNTFPLGIQMHLVPAYERLTNGRAQEMYRKLQGIQQDFLVNTTTSMTRTIPTLDLADKDTKADLRALLMSIPDPCKPSEKLFYAVNNRGSADGIIFRYYRQKSNNVRAAMISKLVNALQIRMNIPNSTDAITETPTLEHTKKFIPPSKDVSVPQNKQMVSMVLETIFPENRPGFLHCLLQTITMLHNARAPLRRPHMCIAFPSRYSMRHWLDAFLFLQQITAWDLWRYWKGVDNPYNFNALPAISTTMGRSEQARLSL